MVELISTHIIYMLESQVLYQFMKIMISQNTSLFDFHFFFYLLPFFRHFLLIQALKSY